jgi:pyruvate dehydrogenase E2 component (dihydrolipoamide acetyltransferase)
MARLAIRMPKMSMTMTEGEMGEWHVSVGDHVEAGDVVCEVMTDKVDMEVESSVSGTLVEIVHESGMVDVGEPIGWVEGEDEGGGFGDLLARSAQSSDGDDRPAPAPPAASDPEAPAASLPEPEPVPAPAAALPTPPAPPGPTAAPAMPADQPSVARPAMDEPTAAVPRARALAAEAGVDLSSVVGTGPDGLVRVADVEALLRRPAQPAASPTSPPRLPAAAPAAGGGQAPSRRAAIRAAVARKMEPSAVIPQFTVWRELHLDAADRERGGVSWTTTLMRAYAAALREVPDLLCRWEGAQAVDSGAPSIALAVATDRGLLVPTFADPDRGSASDLDAEIRNVVKAAHAGKLGPAYLGVANGSLSNLGGMGVDRFQALLTPPQASVLALGSIAPRPVAVPGGVGLALTVHAGVTVDHRVADGAHAADLLAAMARHLGETLD